MNAHTQERIVEPRITRPTTGGFLVTDKQLAALGDGDIAAGRKRLRMTLADERAAKPIIGPIQKPEGVRIATPDDELALFDLLMLDLEENALAVGAPSPEKIRELIMACTRTPKVEGRMRGMLPVIDGPDGDPIAFAAIVPNQWWWSAAWYLMEVVLFVHPDHRRAQHAQHLLQFECWMSDQLSQSFGYRVYAMAGVTATKGAKRKMRLYRQFMNEVGGFFIYPSFDEGAAS